MKLNTVLLSLFLLTSNQAFSWEWPMSLKLSWFGSWFMNKEEKHFNNVVMKLKNEKIETQTKSTTLSVSTIFQDSYNKHLKRLMMPIDVNDENLKKTKMILRRSFFIHGSISNITEGINNFATFSVKAIDKIKPDGSDDESWPLPRIDKKYADGGYSELFPLPTELSNEIAEAKMICREKVKEYDDISPNGDLTTEEHECLRFLNQDYLRRKALSYIEKSRELDRNIDAHNKAVEKNKTLYTALLNKHGIKLD